MSVGGRNQGAHQYGIMDATSRPEPHEVKISEIAATGEKLDSFANQEKVARMRRQLRSGHELPPVRIERLTPELRDKYGVTDPSKKFYLSNGHHRLAARRLEGETTTPAIDYHRGKRL